jgi:hypothetical protein
MSTESDALAALGRRAVACKGWRWLPGMRATDGARVLAVGTSDAVGLILRTADQPEDGTRGDDVGWDPPRDRLPDLADPATLGATIALAREAWGGRGMQGATLSMQAWRATEKRIWWRPESLGMAAHRLMEPVDGVYRWGEPATEAEAWVRALELAPG